MKKECDICLNEIVDSEDYALDYDNAIEYYHLSCMESVKGFEDNIYIQEYTASASSINRVMSLLDSM